MSLLVILGVAVAVGAGIGRWWASVLPLAIGAVVAASLAAGGRGLADTPMAFLVLVATAAITVGVVVPRRWPRPSTVP